VCYIDLTFFGRSAEIANQYLQKGSKILVDGRLNFEQWVSEDGTKRSKHSVIVETMKMVESKNALENRAQNTQQQSQSYRPPEPTYQNAQGQQVTQQQYQQQTQQYQQRPMPEQVPVIDIDEDEIPF
jgi:single-strand DNA-binding protein